MNTETRKLIKAWVARARLENDAYVRFFILYMCVDAWMTASTSKDSDQQKLKWLKTSDNVLKKYWNNTPHKNVPLNGIKAMGQIEYLLPSKRGQHEQLNDIEDFSQVVDILYQIRCNLFHGGKSPNNRRDSRLVWLSANVLQTWLEWTLIKTD